MRRLCVVLLLAASPALADDFPLSADLPRCGPPMSGRTMCRDGMAFECHLVAPASTRAMSGWQWESNILLPCEASVAPADLPDDHRRDLPPGFTYAPRYGDPQYGAPQFPQPSSSARQRPSPSNRP